MVARSRRPRGRYRGHHLLCPRNRLDDAAARLALRPRLRIRALVERGPVRPRERTLGLIVRLWGLELNRRHSRSHLAPSEQWWESAEYTVSEVRSRIPVRTLPYGRGSDRSRARNG